MTVYNLIICIVPHDEGEFITKTAVSAGAGGGTAMMGRGTTASGVLHALALGDMPKDIVYILVPAEKKSDIVGAIAAASETKKKKFGVLVTTDAAKLLKTGKVSGGDDYMVQKTTHQMITVIANKGYADDIMAAARKAGAEGQDEELVRHAASECSDRPL